MNNRTSNAIKRVFMATLLLITLSISFLGTWKIIEEAKTRTQISQKFQRLSFIEKVERHSQKPALNEVFVILSTTASKLPDFVIVILYRATPYIYLISLGMLFYLIIRNEIEKEIDHE
ncbi:hypothetical protein ACQ9ZH_20990 [Pseudomonas chlororaphis]